MREQLEKKKKNWREREKRNEVCLACVAHYIYIVTDARSGVDDPAVAVQLRRPRSLETDGLLSRGRSSKRLAFHSTRYLTIQTEETSEGLAISGISRISRTVFSLTVETEVYLSAIIQRIVRGRETRRVLSFASKEVRSAKEKLLYV
ncbi:hypothetical protein PUN28_008100 [Cardiocondyla obscurior]|uniref:Uncharacterized protein n=1 Tax=Cardiocondyla obscurior TaxID=286306 RepID=A0AAW2G2D1_9HYME